MHSEANTINAWYKHPWVVLIIGVILWIILLTMAALLWYRCFYHRKKCETIKDREFIKIRDGSVPNNLQQRGTTFWPPPNGDAYEATNGGGCLVAETTTTNQDPCNYSDYGSGAETLPHCALRYNPSACLIAPAASSTLQRRSHSPSQHYHYAQLPDLRDGAYAATSSVISGDNDGLPTFCNHVPRTEVNNFYKIIVKLLKK